MDTWPKEQEDSGTFFLAYDFAESWRGFTELQHTFLATRYGLGLDEEE